MSPRTAEVTASASASPTGDGGGGDSAPARDRDAPRPPAIILRILGQEIIIPASVATALILAVVFIPIVIVLYYVLTGPRSSVAGHLVTAALGGTFNEGELTQQTETLYEFWTPGPETEKYLRETKDKNGVVLWETLKPEQQKWYAADEKTLVEFAAELMAHTGTQGYSRALTYGQGKGPLKPGWTWRLTTTEGSTLSIQSILRLYEKYFHRDKNIYLEVFKLNASLRAVERR